MSFTIRVYKILQTIRRKKMPVIKRDRPDGSTEWINSPSVLKINPATGNMEKVPTTRTVISAEGEVLAVEANRFSPKVQGTASIVPPKNNVVAPKGQDVTSVILPKDNIDPALGTDMVMGNIALLGTGLAKFVRFITRTGDVKKANVKGLTFCANQLPDRASATHLRVVPSISALSNSSFLSATSLSASERSLPPIMALITLPTAVLSAIAPTTFGIFDSKNLPTAVSFNFFFG